MRPPGGWRPSYLGPRGYRSTRGISADVPRDQAPTFTFRGNLASFFPLQPAAHVVVSRADSQRPLVRDGGWNHLDAVLAGRADWRTWLKGLLTYGVPFCVSNWGIVTASRRRLT